MFTASAARRLVLAVSLLVACGGGDLVLPGSGEPAAIRVLDGDGQNGRVGAALAKPVVVLVSDAQGRPVAGVPVVFAFDGETDASVSPDSTGTDADGQAAFEVTMGSRVGALAARVAVDAMGPPALSAPVTLTAVSADANQLARVSGDSQSAPAGAALPDPLVVQVTDGFGNPIAGVEVTWTADGGGSVSDATTETGSDGLTSVQRTLGQGAGTQRTLASAEGLAGSPVEFTHTATAGAATVLEKVSGDNQSAMVNSALANPLVVRAHDEAGNPVSGLAVTWVVGEGGGSLAPATGVTDGQGRVSTTWTLGGDPGRNSATAVASGIGTVTFSATAAAPERASTTTEITSDDPDPSDPGQPVRVRFRVRSSSGAPEGTVRVESDDGASCSATVAAGECTLSLDTPGGRTLTATYGGSGAFEGSAGTESHQVRSPSPPPSPPPPPAGVSATESSVKVNHDHIDVRDHADVNVKVRDADGHDLAGIVVTLSATGGGNSITPASVTTNNKGEGKFTFRSSEEGTKTFTAVAGGVVLADHPTIEVQD